MTDPVRVLVADDHLIIRQGLRMILETEPGFELVGEAGDGAQAVDLAARLQPDVILMDLRMPGMDGLTAIQVLHEKEPQLAVVILTTFNEDGLMLRGLRLGAKGYLLKDTDRATLFHTLRAAARGETLLKPDILARILAGAGEEEGAASALSERELEVLRGVAHGERSKEIAGRLGITERTVKAHLANIYHKLGVDSRAAAIAAAAQRHLL